MARKGDGKIDLPADLRYRCRQKKKEGTTARKEACVSIRIQEEKRLFTLETAHTMYQMKADETGVLLHIWYGEKTGEDMSSRTAMIIRWKRCPRNTPPAG